MNITAEEQAILDKVASDFDDIDVERDTAERDAARDYVEQNDVASEGKSANGLGSLLPVEYSIMRGLGPEGPHRVFIPEWIPTDEVDEDGEPVWKLKVHKKKIGPFKLGVQMDASECLAAMHEDTFRAAIAWSFKQGEGDLTAEEVVGTLEKMYPKKVVGPTGGEITRPAFTEEQVVAMFNSTVRDLNEDHIEAMCQFVSLALKRYNPDIDSDWIGEHCDYGLLVRIIGKLLWLNGGLRDRFLA